MLFRSYNASSESNTILFSIKPLKESNMTTSQRIPCQGGDCRLLGRPQKVKSPRCSFHPIEIRVFIAMDHINSSSWHFPSSVSWRVERRSLSTYFYPFGVAMPQNTMLIAPDALSETDEEKRTIYSAEATWCRPAPGTLLLNLKNTSGRMTKIVFP